MVASAAAKLGVYFLALLLLLAHNASGMRGGNERNSGKGNTENGRGRGQNEQPENPECAEACLDEQVLDQLDLLHPGAVRSLFESPNVRALADGEIDEKTHRPTTNPPGSRRACPEM